MLYLVTLKKYSLEFTVFLSGAIVMILELVAARTLAPYFGTSINTWTILIGVILGSLSLGYWYGGRIADRKVSHEGLARILFWAGCNLLGVALAKDLVIYFVGKIPFLDLIWGTVVVVFVLFFSPNVLLGMISPYIAKIKLRSLSTSGARIGSLYAISTVGSIVGTFGAGFWLIPLFGIAKIILIMGVLLISMSIFVSPHRLRFLKIFLLTISAIIACGFTHYESFAKKSGLIDIDSRYGRILIYSTIHPLTHKDITYLITGAFGFQSGKSEGEVSSYISISSKVIDTMTKNKGSLLVLGGGAFSMPDYFVEKYPKSHVDVVEIDPEIVRLAPLYFGHKNNDRLRTFIADGRMFINSSSSLYDVVFNDAYTDIYPPYSLSTQEAIKKIYGLLNPDGIYLSNVISALEGKNSGLFQTLHKTYSSVFSHVLVIPMQPSAKKEDAQNILLVGLKSQNVDAARETLLPFRQWKGEISSKAPLLTDDYAPIENFLLSITSNKPLYPISRYFLDASIGTSKRYIASLLGLK